LRRCRSRRSLLPFRRSMGDPVILLSDLQQAVARVSHAELLSLVSGFRRSFFPMSWIKHIRHG
jgi:hypothetical protein